MSNLNELDTVIKIIGKKAVEALSPNQYSIVSLAIDSAYIDYDRQGEQMLVDMNCSNLDEVIFAYVESAYENINDFC